MPLLRYDYNRKTKYIRRWKQKNTFLCMFSKFIWYKQRKYVLLWLCTYFLICCFSKKSCFIILRSSYTQKFFKADVIRNFAIFTGKHVLESLFIKLPALWPGTLFQCGPKRDFNTGDFCENCKIFMNSFFMEHLWWLTLSVW